MHMRSLLAMTAAGLMAAAPALAQVAATAATDLNLRAGPGPAFEVVGVIPSDGEVTVQGCVADQSWCQVDFQGTSGWAYGEYLNATLEGQPDPVVVIENREPLQIQTVEAPEADEAVGAAAGAAIASALIGGPAAILAGAALGATVADDDPAIAYVRENPVDPIYLEGEVVVGAGIPEEVEVVTIPDTTYGYINVNGLPVLVDTSNRQIVRIVR